MGKATPLTGSPAERESEVAAGNAAVLVKAELARRSELSPQTLVRVSGLIDRFVAFAARGYGIELVSELNAIHVAAFVNSVTARDHARPSIATMRLRRWVVRLFFRVVRDLDLATDDPTADLVLPSRVRRTARPLTDAEVATCERAALHDLSRTRLTVAWALGEATARTSEIPRVRVSDVDFENQRVWIGGSARTTARWGYFTDWGARQVRRRMLELNRAGYQDPPLAVTGEGNRESGVSYSAQSVRETLERAGLAGLDRVAPGSLAGWAGTRVFEQSGRIEEVARRLGVQTLDAAARVIDWDWQTGPDDPDG